MGTLYMVGTPIGNLEDITVRALRILKEVDVIACEDTRHTSLLLSRYDIKKRLIACHSYNEEESAKGIISLLDQNLNVAYCSDAGTPGVSDPGARLVERVRRESDHPVVPIPGA
ncbi:MAG: rRNA (cytidine-2'-O-)-methyltransferase, partial [Sphaerochaetaceae bacterium]|nr:rRNA (cytidine-2'-O-)-methyltransferase [Sphaerochaetaceae bacterium]